MQMSEFDAKIKVINNRCQNELMPRQKALQTSEQTIKDDIEKLSEQIDFHNQNLDELNQEINRLQLAYE